MKLKSAFITENTNFLQLVLTFHLQSKIQRTFNEDLETGFWLPFHKAFGILAMFGILPRVQLIISASCFLWNCYYVLHCWNLKYCFMERCCIYAYHRLERC